MNDSLPPNHAIAVATSIGDVWLRRGDVSDVADVETLREASDAPESLRAYFSTIAYRRESDDGGATLSADEIASLTADEIASLTADDLELMVKAYVDGFGGQTPPTTTIDQLAPRLTDAGDVRTQLREMHAFLPEPLAVTEATKANAAEQESAPDAVADAQKRVDEIDTLLGQREEARTVGATSAAAPDREGEFIALALAAQKNAKAVEHLGGLARSLTEFMVEVDETRRQFDRATRRSIAIGIGILGVACVLSALSLVQDFLRNRALDESRESDELRQVAQRNLEKDVAQFREERARLVARIDKLEAENGVLAAEMAKAAEAARAVEAARLAEALKAKSKGTKAAKSAKSTAR